MLRTLSLFSHFLTLNLNIMKFFGHFYGQSVFYAVFPTLVRQFYTIHQMRIVYPRVSLRESLEKVEWTYPNCALVPTGDFNKLDIESIAKTFQLKPMVDFRTRPINTLDKIFSILLEFYSSFNSFPQFGLSDHLTIVVSPGFPKKSQKPWTKIIKVRDKSPSNIASVGRYLLQIPLSNVISINQSCDRKLSLMTEKH